MSEETIRWLVTVAIVPVVVWLTQKLLPYWQKRSDDSTAFVRKEAGDEAAHSRQREDSDQGLGSDIAKQLLAHVITLTDGQFSGLRKEITDSFREQDDKLDAMIASQNQIIVFMSRNQAALPVIGHVTDWTDAKEIESAAIASAAVQKTDSVVAASVKSEPVEDAPKVIAIVEALPAKGDK